MKGTRHLSASEPGRGAVTTTITGSGQWDRISRDEMDRWMGRRKIQAEISPPATGTVLKAEHSGQTLTVRRQTDTRAHTHTYPHTDPQTRSEEPWFFLHKASSPSVSQTRTA